MKLTIKRQPDKNAPKQELTSSHSSTHANNNKLKSPCCDIESSNSRHILVRPPKKQQKTMYDLIRIDCMTTYSRLNPKLKIDILQDTITKTLYRQSIRYQPWIGYLCTHCCHNYQHEMDRLSKIGQFVKKFRAAFEEKKCESSILKQTIKRVKLYCSDSSVNPTDETFIQICKKYQQTFLLQFIPVQYSKYIIQRYLSPDGDLQQYVRLCTSLSHFVLNTCNPINQQHFINIMMRPYMGTVEWPIIIANRNIFDSNPNNEPTIEKN